MSKVKSTLNKDTCIQTDNRPRGKKRLELVLLGLNAGKSQRRIAAELGFDEGTVRRDLKILLLPEACLRTILTGASAEKYLRGARHQAAENAKRLRLAEEKQAAEISKTQRLAEEGQTGRHSNSLARLLLRWLNKKLSAASYMEQLLQIVDSKNWRLGDQMAIPVSSPFRMLMLCEQGDEPGYMPDKIEFLAVVLLSVLPLIAPERLIRCRAIEKTIRAVENPRKYLPELRS